MKTLPGSRGFSLIEVMVAAGIFASAVVVIIGFMMGLSQQSGESIESLAAQRLPDALKVELDRLAAAGLDDLAGQIPVMAAPLAGGLAFAAAREAGSTESMVYLIPATGRISVDEQYYLLECWRFPAEPLAFEIRKAFLALQVRVSWPYRLPGVPAPVPLADRRQVTFTLSLNR